MSTASYYRMSRPIKKQRRNKGLFPIKCMHWIYQWRGLWQTPVLTNAEGWLFTCLHGVANTSPFVGGWTRIIYVCVLFRNPRLVAHHWLFIHRTYWLVLRQQLQEPQQIFFFFFFPGSSAEIYVPFLHLSVTHPAPWMRLHFVQIEEINPNKWPA